MEWNDKNSTHARAHGNWTCNPLGDRRYQKKKGKCFVALSSSLKTCGMSQSDKVAFALEESTECKCKDSFWLQYLSKHWLHKAKTTSSFIEMLQTMQADSLSGAKLVWRHYEESTLAHVVFNKHSEVEVVWNHSSTPHCVCKIILLLRSELPFWLLLLWDRELFIISNCDTGSKIMRTSYLDSAWQFLMLDFPFNCANQWCLQY